MTENLPPSGRSGVGRTGGQLSEQASLQRDLEGKSASWIYTVMPFASVTITFSGCAPAAPPPVFGWPLPLQAARKIANIRAATLRGCACRARASCSRSNPLIEPVSPGKLPASLLSPCAGEAGGGGEKCTDLCLKGRPIPLMRLGQRVAPEDGDLVAPKGGGLS